MKINQATLDYIHAHAETDVRQLALQGTKDPEVDMLFALDQIAGRQKARTKIPSWAAIDGIIYPPHLSMEQCSSERTARYKASLSSSVGEVGRGLLVDLTGGFGVDFAFMASHFERAVYVERQEQLCAISSENFRLLDLPAEVVCGDGIDYLHSLDHADMIFIDPARRDEHGGRTFGIADCTPNVLEILDEMLGKADRILLKLSPMLDWRKAVDDLGEQVSEVHIVSVDNECKELLVMVKDHAGGIIINCVNLQSTGHHQFFRFNYTPQAICSPLSEGGVGGMSSFLFEPNASIMKAGCFDLLSERFGIRQLDKNSHLFVLDAEIPKIPDFSDFPGRQFTIERITSMNKRELKEALAGIDRANITVRNFPLSVADLRKRLKLKDGGDIYVFATTVAGQGHQLFICRKKS